jgi:flagellar motor component MotA
MLNNMDEDKALDKLIEDPNSRIFLESLLYGSWLQNNFVKTKNDMYKYFIVETYNDKDILILNYKKMLEYADIESLVGLEDMDERIPKEAYINGIADLVHLGIDANQYIINLMIENHIKNKKTDPQIKLMFN